MRSTLWKHPKKTVPASVRSYRGLVDPALASLKWSELYGFFRRKLFDRDNGTCGICGLPVIPTAFDLDHVIQLAEGGPDHWDNLRVTHPRCNRTRPKFRTAVEWLGIPEDLHTVLKERSERDQRSLNGQIIWLLRRAIEAGF